MSVATEVATPTRQLGSGQDRPVAGKRLRPSLWALLVVPYLVFLLVVYAYPVYDILRQSVSDFVPPQQGGLDNYQWFFETSSNIRILARTVITAAIVTVITLLLAYPYAYYLTIVRPRARMALLAIVLVPFWTSLMVRNFAWVVLLQEDGPIKAALRAVGGQDIQLLGNITGVVIGEIQILLPFVILPLYARLRTIDRRLLDAAGSLGAPPWRGFLKVYLPLSVPGMLSGGVLAFVLSLGFYVTPMLLGSSREQLLSPLMVTQVNQLLAFGRGGAMAAVLLLVSLFLIGAVFLATRNKAGDGAGFVEPRGEPAEASRHPVLSGAVGIVALVLVLPALIVFPMSFTGAKTFSFPPQEWSTRWWARLFSNPDWLHALLNSLALAAAVSILATVLGTLAALGLNRGGVPGAGLLNGFFLVPLAAPVVVAAIGIYAVFLRWHLTGTFTGFLLAHTALSVPFVLVPVMAALRGFDRRLESAAASLGAGSLSTFRNVTLPLIAPSVITGALFAFATSLDETVVSIFLVSPTYRTLPVQIFTSVSRDVDPTVAAASSLIFGATVLTALVMFARVWHRERRKGLQ
jgi:putative spermidine/putrescine transport system permease protein